MVLKLLLTVFCCCRLNAALENNRYYPRYHLAPVKGFMNDPNGLCEFNGVYHLFYQYNPESSLEPGIARWGHATSKDLFHWVDAGIAIQNDSVYDYDGVFSGSAVIDSGVMNIFYTGNLNFPDQNPEKIETQILVTSNDGFKFTKYEHNPIITSKDLQPHIRDPKVWKHEGNWYMVLGNSFYDENNQRLGRIILFKSPDKINWNQVSILDESDGGLGYMWECPDLFEIDGYFVLLLSPQGIKAQGDRYKNLYQVGYYVGRFNYTSNLFTPLTELTELDFGHDFYATHTYLDSKGRRLLVAWMNMWERSYPEGADGFNGQMTMIRTLSLSPHYKLLQRPVKEVVSLRGKKLYNGSASGGTTVTLSNKTGEVLIIASCTQDLTLYIGNNTSSVEIKYEYLKGRALVKRDDKEGFRRTKYRPSNNLKINIFIDASSIEAFFGNGEVTFSSRFFIDSPINVTLGEDSSVDRLTVYDMKSTLYV